VTRRPTPPPLTKTERAALDDLIRRGARALNSAEQNRLLRLLELDRADREQERRVAGGMERANRALQQQVKDLEAQLAEPCMEPLPPSVSKVYPLGPCIVTGPHVEHRDPRGATWVLNEPCGAACSEGHTYYGRCVLQSGDEMGDALRRISGEVARHRAAEDGAL